MRKVLSILARLLTGAAIALMLLSNATEELTSGLWGGICVLLAVLCGFLEERMKRQDNQKKPITSVEATVVSHYKVRERVGRNNYVIRCYITFKTADEQVIEFNVSEIDYDDFDIGEIDLLRYRGWEFLSFGVKDKSHIKPIAPLPEEYEPAPEQKSTAAKAKESIIALWNKLTSRSTAKPEAVVREERPGILTHELDE